MLGNIYKESMKMKKICDEIETKKKWNQRKTNQWIKLVQSLRMIILSVVTIISCINENFNICNAWPATDSIYISVLKSTCDIE